MRILLNLLAVLSFIQSIFMQSSFLHNIHCNFQLRNGIYYCTLNDVNIITEILPLRFFSVHLPNYGDSDVTGIDTWELSPQNISVRVFHPQLIRQFPNVQFIQFSDSRVHELTNNSFGRCDELIELILDRNPFTSIPPRTFQNCTKLRTLDLTVSSALIIISESFRGLENLHTLRIARLFVSNTLFEHLLQLRQLRLTSIIAVESNALRHMTQLEILEFHDNLLGLNVIQGVINGIQSLLRLALNRNGFTTFDFVFFEQFVKLEEFELIDNQLTLIQANSFRNYRNLKILRLHANHISVLNDKSFSGLRSLETLTLNHNRLTHLPPNVFHELINLKFLELSNNIIQQIDPETFTGLQSLENLFMNNIQLSKLNSGMFEPLAKLQVLQIIGGNIESIPSNIFSPMKNLRDLHLGGNRITRLNSNSFGYLPFVNSFLIDHSVWDQGLNKIERTFFNNFPRMAYFGGNFGNNCFNGGIVNITSIDFSGETLFDRCFSNWDAVNPTTTTQTTTELNTTPIDSPATSVTSATKLCFLMMLIVVKLDFKT